MRRYRTSISIKDLDRIIAGDRPTIDLFPFLLRHRGKRTHERFKMHSIVGSISGTIEPYSSGTVVELRPQRTLLFIVVGMFSIAFTYILLFQETLSINDEPATRWTRSYHLLLVLLIPAAIWGWHQVGLSRWIAKLEQDMNLERVG